MTRIKTCGLSRPCDVAFVNEARPDWCGFIIDFPRSHRIVTPGRPWPCAGSWPRALCRWG